MAVLMHALLAARPFAPHFATNSTYTNGTLRVNNARPPHGMHHQSGRIIQKQFSVLQNRDFYVVFYSEKHTTKVTVNYN